MASEAVTVIAGVDTHADSHYVALNNEDGDQNFLAVGSGYLEITE